MQNKKITNMLPIGVLRMAGFPVELLNQFRIGNLSSNKFEEKVQDLRKKLHNLFFTNEMIQEAIWISSDSSYRSLNKYDFCDNRNSKARNFEKLLTKYLFRFCYKNDTNSFFGPSSYVILDQFQKNSIDGTIDDLVANRDKTDIRVASWVKNIPQRLLRDYSKSEGVKKKSEVMEKILNETEGQNSKKHWRWYNERTPIYELCPSNVNLSIGGQLYEDIKSKSLILCDNFTRFNSAMYWFAVQKEFYKELFNTLEKRIRSNKLTDWFDFIYSGESHNLDYIEDEMVLYGRKLFQQIFVENNIQNMRHAPISPFFSPDFLISSPSIQEINKGHYDLIVGDMHGALTCYQQPPTFYYGNKLFQKSIQTLNESVFADINFCFPKKYVPDTFDFPPGFDIEKSIENQKLRVEDGEIRLENPTTYIEYLFNDALAKIIPLGTFHLERFFPDTNKRIYCDNTIIKRKSCIIHSNEYLEEVNSHKENQYAEWHSLFEGTRKFFEQRKFRGVLFVKPDSEYKPFAIDFDNPFCSEILQSYAKQSTFLEVQEMFPGEKSLWLSNSNGRYTSELRLSFYEGKK